MREDREVHTSPPIPSEYSDFLEKLLERYDRLISFHVSRELSNCYTSVQSAIKLMFDDAADRVFPVDTRKDGIPSPGKALTWLAQWVLRPMHADETLFQRHWI